MAKHLSFKICTVCLMNFVSFVICGRVPVGINRVDLVDEDSNSKSLQSSEEYYDLDSIHSENNPVYITDVQIDELQDAQEKISHDEEIYHVDPRCPTFNGFCNAATCSSDGDCGSKICCYNGCVHTCAEDKSPPIAIDWIPLGEQKLALLSDRTKETITIQGGCKVTHKQRKSLDLFLKYGHVTKCVCMQDDVVCYVRKRYPSSISTNNSSGENLTQV